MFKIKDKFENVNDEFLKFKHIKNKKASCPDVNAFILLDKLFPSKINNDLISSAEHDIIYLNISELDIDTLTDKQILELVRCGIGYDEEYGCLYKFV